MPTFVEANTGLQVDATIATFNGRVRPGFREVLANGERVDFNISMMDTNAVAGRMFLTDSDSNAWSKAVRDAIRDSRYFAADNRMAIVHGEAPAVRGAPVTDTATVRDMIRLARYT